MTRSGSGYRRLLFVWLAWLVSLPALASPVGPIDLVDAYQLALENDRTLSAAKNQFMAAKEKLSQAKRLYLPNVTVSYDLTETYQNIVDSDNEVFGQGESDYSTDDYGVQLTQPLLRMDFIAERKKSREQIRVADLDFEAEKSALILRAAQSYLDILSARENLALARTEVAVLETRLKGAEKRFEVGVADATEVHESRARYEFTKAEAIDAENVLSDAREGLAVLIGGPVDGVYSLMPEFPLLPPDPDDVETWLKAAEAGNYRLLSTQALTDVAVREVKRQKAARYPTLDLSVDSGTRVTGGSLFGGGSEVESRDVLLRFAIPLYRGGQISSRVDEAVYLLQRSEDQYEALRRDVRRRTLAAYREVIGGISRISALAASVEAQELTLKAVQRGFETGSNDNIEVLDAQRDLYLANRDYANARYGYIVSSLRLQELTGSLEESDLVSVNGYLTDAPSSTTGANGGDAIASLSSRRDIDVAGLASALLDGESRDRVDLVTSDGLEAVSLPKDVLNAANPDAVGCGIRLEGAYPVYAKADFVTASGETAIVTARGLRARSRPSTAEDSVVLGQFVEGEAYRLVERLDGWVKVLGPIDIELCLAEKS